jgi:hypothetical protein
MYKLQAAQNLDPPLDGRLTGLSISGVGTASIDVVEGNIERRISEGKTMKMM